MALIQTAPGNGCERTRWISHNILPHERALRRLIVKWRPPFSLDVDDVIQECYAKIAGLTSVADISCPRNYLFQVARSIFLMHIRRQSLVPIGYLAEVDELWLAAKDASPETALFDREQLNHLARAVTELPEPNRTAFALRFVHGLSLRQTGDRLGMSENAVQKMLAKSLNLLAHQIGRDRQTRPGRVAGTNRFRYDA